jgi:protein tyrosine phosphatase (PTP) superfamily phosphohydrolase (DUF442 family)
MFVLFLIAAASGYCIVLFGVMRNFQEVVPGKVYRSGQPSPAQLRNWVEQYKIKTILNLRGHKQENIEAEEAIARELGLKMISMRVSSHRLPARYIILDLIKQIESLEPPVLIHCYSGIDRAGTASALAAMAIGNVDYEEAKWNAYVAPGPWKRRKYEDRKYFKYYSHISDIFKLYESYCKRNNLETNDWQQLKQWVVNTKSLPEVEPK